MTEIAPPASLAIVGAGPIGLEAALYARYMGYRTFIYEKGRVAENVLQWGGVRMFSPFLLNSSPLGLAALAAQNPDYRPPAPEDFVTGNEWVERYLQPLAESDLLADGIHTGVEVLQISRDGFLKTELDQERADSEFRLLLRDRAGEESEQHVDGVIDASGVFGHPNYLGPGGAPALGEQALRRERKIEYGLPDVSTYAGKHTLLIGSGYSAATNLIALAELAAKDAGATRATWLTRANKKEEAAIAEIENDSLPLRSELTRRANHLATHETSWLQSVQSEHVAEIQPTEAGGFQVRLAEQEAEVIECDRIVANVGYRGDLNFHRELQSHACYASEGAMKLAAALLGQDAADCLQQTSCGPQTLRHPEPHFYQLGAKSYGRNSQFLFSLGLEQIREMFTLIVGRENLDLYENMRKSKLPGLV